MYKKWFVTTIATVVLLTSCSGSRRTQEVIFCGLKMDIPDTWEKADSQQSGNTGSEFYDSETGTLMVMYTEQPLDVPIDNEFFKTAYIEGFKTDYEGYVEHDSGIINIADDSIPSIYVEFSGTTADRNIAGKNYLLFYNDYAITIMYCDLDTDEFIERDMFQKIIDSIEVVEE